MNKRQAKKQYKKIHGHNPPKTAVAVYTPEEIEAMKIYNNLTPEDIERIANNLRSAAAEMFKALQRVAESMARGLEDMGKNPIVITSPIVRLYFKKLASDYYKDIIVISYNEVESNVELQSVGMVTA